MARRVKEKNIAMAPKDIDMDMLKNLDLLMSMDVIEEEENWDAAAEEKAVLEGESDD